MSRTKLPRASILFCFCGPVASGKSTICTKVSSLVDQVELSVSSTTRSPRPGEEDGVHYHFLERQEFESRIANEGFIEYAEFNGNLYGTEKRVVDQAVVAAQDLLLDIEIQGVAQLKKLYPDNLVTVFVLPPSKDVLTERLRARGSGESEKQIATRLEIAKTEIAALMSPGFSDYLLINEDLEPAVQEAVSIVLSERNRYKRIDSAALLKDFS
jgi:guanylate kinase